MMSLARIIRRGETKIETDPILGETIVTPIRVEKDGVGIDGLRLSRCGVTILDFSQLDPFAFYPDAMYGRPFMADLIFEQLRQLMAQITASTTNLKYSEKEILKWD